MTLDCHIVSMNFDRILSQLGEFGWWQRRNNLLLWLPSAAAGINVLIAAFAVMGPRNGFRCRNSCDGEQLSWNFPHHSPSEMFPSLDPSSPHYSPDTPDYCQYYRAEGDLDSCTFNTSDPPLECKRGADFVYAKFEMERTVATDNDLVCNDYFWTIIVDEFYMLGLFLGSFVFGVMSDKFGRRPTLLVSVVTCSAGNLLGCAMPNHWSYALTRILAAAGGQGTFMVAFTLTLEYSGVKERVPLIPWVTWSTLLANLINVPFSLGESLPPLFALALPDWREYQAAISSVMLISALAWLFLPESPRWLIAKGRTGEARRIIEAAADTNNVKLHPDVFTEETVQKPEEADDHPVYGPLDLFRTSQLLITLPLFFCWPVITLLFYGLSLSADKIQMTDDVYLSFILVSLIEIPSHLLLPLVIDVWGRKPIFFLTQFVPGICCIVAAFLTPGTGLFAVLTLSAKAAVTAAFNTTYIYTAQLFPTSIRATAVGACSTMARLGGAMAPIVGKYLIEIGSLPEIVPLCLFGGFGVAGGLCALLLPETLGFPLPASFQDVDRIKKNGKPMWKCYQEATEPPTTQH